LRELSFDGRLTVHRVALDDPMRAPDGAAWEPAAGAVQQAFLASTFPSQAFAWQAALLAERLVDDEGIDIIEAQEWEAPLYHLQLRRAAGLGPARRPPCVVHLHSPTEQIFAANSWSTAVADYAPATAMEAWSICHADAVLAPSRFIADETAARHGLQPDSITVIPYPLGAGPVLARSDAVWQAPSICHIGRLELRKGVLEWAQAVALAAPEHPCLQAEFAGGDTPRLVTGGDSVRRVMRGSVQAAARRHLRFRGNLDTAGLQALLAKCSIGVVPSRWENFPNSCMEAMRSGLPMIVAPHGGMTEMVVDGVSGWQARDGSPAGLADALRRALATPAEQRRAMGDAAALRIRQLCDSATVVARQLAFRSALVAQAGAASVDLPCSASVPATPLDARRTPSPGQPAVVVICAAGLAAAPDLQACCAELFAQDPGLVLVSGWVRDGTGRLLLPDGPAAPHLTQDGKPFPLLVLRKSALDGLGHGVDALPGGAEALAGALLAAGGRGLVLPGVLGGMAEHWCRAAPAPLSAMALAVQRQHLPLLVWLARCTPAYRRAMVGRVMAGLWHRVFSGPGLAVVGPASTRTACSGRTGVPVGSADIRPGLVSVIIAACNAEATIHQTLASALGQTWRDIEVIVVDDGSTDATARIVSAIAAADPRLRLIRQRNRGVAAARNLALRASSGEFVAPMDADDLWAPAKLERMVGRLQQAGQQAGFAYCWWAVIDAGGNVLDRSPHWREEGRVLARLAEVNFAGSASVPVFRRACLLQLGGYDTRLRDLAAQGCEDWDLLLRIAEHHGVVCVPEVLVAYRRHAGSMSSGCAAMWRSGGQVLAELAARQPDLPPAVLRAGLGQFALHLAGVAYWSGRHAEACAWILRSRSPAMVLRILPALLRLVGRRVIGLRSPAPQPLAIDPVQRFDACRLPEPLMPYAQIHARRWRRQPGAAPAPATP
jgi:glycosyltransferase involved in cell wall biosynthesis